MDMGIKRLYKDIRCWYRHCFNRYHWRTVKEAILGYPFDYGYIYSLELVKLEEMLHYFEHAKVLDDSEYKHMIKYIKLTIEMLHIFMDDGKGKYKDGLFKSVNATRTENHPFNWDLVSNIKYVNRKNVKRFDADPEWKDWDIYEAKAFYLYHKILAEKSQYWWD